MNKLPKLPKHYSFKTFIDLGNPGSAKFTLCYKRWWMDDYVDLYTVHYFHKPSYNEKFQARLELTAYAWRDRNERPSTLRVLWDSIVHSRK